MLYLLDNIAIIWSFWVWASFLISLLAILKRNNKKIFLVGVGQLVLTALIGVGLVSQIGSLARSELVEFLDQPNLVVTINRARIDVAIERVFLSDLLHISNMKGHHSHVLNEIDVEISNGVERVVVSLGQDSQNPNEYWVFWKKYKSTTKNEIGSFRTSSINQLGLGHEYVGE